VPAGLSEVAVISIWLEGGKIDLEGQLVAGFLLIGQLMALLAIVQSGRSIGAACWILSISLPFMLAGLVAFHFTLPSTGIGLPLVTGLPFLVVATLSLWRIIRRRKGLPG
jgi:hypothetical protein